MRNKVRKIISGGQTGADRAAFDFALEHGIEIGGYVPKGRLSEGGPIPDRYPNLIETPSTDPAERTEANVIHSDATLILSRGNLAGGSKRAEEIAKKFNRPLLRIDFLGQDFDEALEMVRKWLAATECKELNVAGPRASEDPEIYGDVLTFVRRLFADP